MSESTPDDDAAVLHRAIAQYGEYRAHALKGVEVKWRCPFCRGGGTLTMEVLPGTEPRGMRWCCERLRDAVLSALTWRPDMPRIDFVKCENGIARNCSQGTIMTVCLLHEGHPGECRDRRDFQN